MKYFESFTSSKIIELIKATKRSLFICLPSIHPELVDAIIELKDNNNGIFAVEINILVDFEPQTFRDGYGDFESLEKLIQGDDNVKHLKDNRISFIISDDVGYYLFTESRLITSSDNKTVNAVKIDPINIVRLKKHFFDGVESINFEAELKNATNQQKVELENSTDLLSEGSADVSDITDEKVKEISNDLEKNPILNPDFKRIVDFYSAKFQYVKVKFDGANLERLKIRIPPNALPIMDAELRKRMETKLNLFENVDEVNCFKPLNEFKDKIQKLRKEHLAKIPSREESLIEITGKIGFINNIEKLQKEVESVKTNIIRNLASQIKDTREKFEVFLIDFYIKNPSELFPDYPNLWKDIDYIKDETVSLVNNNINWPKAHLLVDSLKLSIQFSDITFEDLKDPEFINELVEAKLIDEKDHSSLAKFGKAVEVSLKKQNI